VQYGYAHKTNSTFDKVKRNTRRKLYNDRCKLSLSLTLRPQLSRHRRRPGRSFRSIVKRRATQHAELCWPFASPFDAASTRMLIYYMFIENSSIRVHFIRGDGHLSVRVDQAQRSPYQIQYPASESLSNPRKNQLNIQLCLGGRHQAESATVW
jgi:hypothetical protein